MSRDPKRPLGVDIHEARLLEWSVVSIPANPSCLLLGPASNRPPADSTAPGKSSSVEQRKESAKLFIRQLEAARLRRQAYSV